MKASTRRFIVSGSLLAVISAGSFALTTNYLGKSSEHGNDGVVDQTSSVSVFSSFHDLFSSQSARDWVTNSDYILDVTMTGERESGGDGFFTARLGDFTTNEVLYARMGAPELGNAFSMRVLGWARSDGADSTQARVATLGSPRLEVGHRYVVGVVRYEPRCSPEDGLDPGGWALVGSNGAIPFDDGRLGWGEVEGKVGERIDPDLGTFQGVVAANRMALNDLKTALAEAPIGERPRQPGVRIGC